MESFNTVDQRWGSFVSTFFSLSAPHRKCIPCSEMSSLAKFSDDVRCWGAVFHTGHRCWVVSFLYPLMLLVQVLLSADHAEKIQPGISSAVLSIPPFATFVLIFILSFLEHQHHKKPSKPLLTERFHGHAGFSFPHKHIRVIKLEISPPPLNRPEIYYARFHSFFFFGLQFSPVFDSQRTLEISWVRTDCAETAWRGAFYLVTHKFSTFFSCWEKPWIICLWII